MEKIKVKVEKVLYRKPDSKWSILATDRGTCKGVVLHEVAAGQLLEIEGKWEVSKFDGKQEFNFRGCILSVPTDLRGLLHYAASLTKGIGPTREDQIWEYFGENWRERDISTIPGITEDITWAWGDALRRIDEQQNQTHAIAFLLGHGATLHMAAVAWEAWHDNTITTVTADPYALTDLPYYGFGAVDCGIRQTFGITDDDPRRVRASILYAINQFTGQGSTVITRMQLLEHLGRIIPDALQQFDDELKNLIDSDKIVAIGDMFCLASDYENENSIWERFAA